MDHKLYLKDPGISKKGNNWYFNKTNQKVVDTKCIARLESFRVPPAWKNIWYSSTPKCHIQVYGTDQAGKKQYIQSEKWINNAKYTKYLRMKQFIKDLQNFKKKISLNSFSLGYRGVVNLLFNLLIDTHLRVGNEKYAESNKTYGLTTLRQKHFVDGKFVFTGKSNIKHSIEIPQEYIPYLKQLNLPDRNKPLFWYRSGNNEIKEISSEELNNFLKENMGNEYTCKDFRTYSANILFIKSFLKNYKKINKSKKCVLTSIDQAASDLGHTRSVSRKSYISDNLINYCLESFDTAGKLSASDLLSKVWS
jgi:DNA topoisomerase-1